MKRFEVGQNTATDCRVAHERDFVVGHVDAMADLSERGPSRPKRA